MAAGGRQLHRILQLQWGCRSERQKQKGARRSRVNVLASTVSPAASSQTPPLPAGKKGKRLSASKGTAEAAVATGKKAKARAQAEAFPAAAPREKRQRVSKLLGLTLLCSDTRVLLPSHHCLPCIGRLHKGPWGAALLAVIFGKAGSLRSMDNLVSTAVPVQS